MLAYSFFLLLITSGMFYVSHDQSKVVVSLLNILLLVVPLVNIILGAIHYYNSSRFIQILLTQPVKRNTIFWGEYLGLSVSLSVSFVIGVLPPALFYGITAPYLYMIISGVLLTFIFESLALLIAVSSADKAKGLWKTILTWFYFTVIYDGIILVILFLFNQYPLQKALLVLTALNPVDVSRTMLLMKMDISALMGVTGAVFQDVLGSNMGIVFAYMLLLLWNLVPVLRARSIFCRKDF